MQEVLDFLILSAIKEPRINRVWLFGSRARGDFHERSDYDVAVDAPNFSESAFARWALEVQENVPTLCGLDLVRVRTEMSQSLKDTIRAEGKIIYDRHQSKNEQ